MPGGIIARIKKRSSINLTLDSEIKLKSLFQKFNAAFDVSFEFFVGEFWVASLLPDFAGKFWTFKAAFISVFCYAAMINCTLLATRMKNNSFAGIAALAHIFAITF
jgi:hypothetical protein